MRCLLVLLVWSVGITAAAAPKVKRKRATTATRSEDLRMWDGSVADVSWVNENTSPNPTPRVKPQEARPWFTISAGAGQRSFQEDTLMVQDNDQKETLSEGRFEDLIDNGSTFEARALFHPLSFLSFGASYHVDDAKLRVNQQELAIAPQELAGTLQIGPRLGAVRVYGFYSQILASRSLASISAPTDISDSQARQNFKVDVKQTGGEGGLGLQIHWGSLGIYAEALRSVARNYELTLTPENAEAATFHASARPSFKAWHCGLSLNF